MKDWRSAGARRGRRGAASLRRRARHRDSRSRDHHQERQGRARFELRIHGRRNSRAGVRLLGLRGHRRSHARRHRSGRRAGAGNRARRHRRQEARRGAGARRQVRSHLGLALAHRSVHRFRSTSSLAVLLAVDAELRRQTGRQPGRSRPCISSGARQVFASTLGSLIDQTRYLPRRGLFGSQLQGWRDPEALLSEFLRRAVSVEGLRAGGRAEAAGERAAHRRRGGGAAFRRSVPRGRIRPDPGQLATGLADPRIHRPPHRARPRAGHARPTTRA